MRVLTWNVNGIRAREAQVLELFEKEKPDVACFQETKATTDQLSPNLYGLTGLLDYHSLWHGSPKGYSGVSVHLRKSRFPEAPKKAHPRFDAETRVVEAHTEGAVFVSVYAPNGGKDYDAKIAFFEAMADYAKAFGDKDVIIAGDINISRTDVDVHKSLRVKESIGQRTEERILLEKVIAGGLVDVGRKLAPDDDTLFTWWPYWRNARQKNVGWRLDMVLASTALAERARTARVLREFGASDHAPLVVDFADP
ncbi:exodeoxyribonuclease III [soil metagenome]